MAPLTAVSIGKVTSLSTSSGAIPFASVIMTTVGAFRSGNTSISIFAVIYRPAAIVMSPRIRTITLFDKAVLIILSSICLYD